MSKKKYFFSIIVLLSGFIQEANAFNGSYKTYFSAIDNPNSSSLEGSIASTIRPKYTLAPNQSYSFNVAYALTANVQSTPLPGEQAIRAYRMFDLNNILYPANTTDSTKTNFTQNLDRLFMTYSSVGFTLNVGRQPIAFGSAKMVNPTDVLTPFSYQELDKEERIGVDAVRMNISLGDLSLLDVGYVARSASFLRLKTNFWATDVSTMIMQFKKNILLGLDISRSIGQASIWFEGAEVRPEDNSQKYFRGTLGLDYKLSSSVYSYFEYHYNSAGELNSARYIFLGNTVAYQEGGVSLRGVHYLIPGMSYEINPIWKLTGQFIFNAKDYSMLNNLLLEHSLAEDVFIDLGTYLPVGPSIQFPQKTEFGIYPKVVYSSIRLYF